MAHYTRIVLEGPPKRMLRRIRAVQAAQGWDLNVCSHGSTEIHSWPHADFAHFWTGTSLVLVGVAPPIGQLPWCTGARRSGSRLGRRWLHGLAHEIEQAASFRRSQKPAPRFPSTSRSARATGAGAAGGGGAYRRAEEGATAVLTEELGTGSGRPEQAEQCEHGNDRAGCFHEILRAPVKPARCSE